MVSSIWEMVYRRTTFGYIFEDRTAATGTLFFRQTNLLAQSFEPRVAAQQSGIFTIDTKQEPAHTNRSNRGLAIQRLENAVLIAQTRKELRLRKLSGHFLRFVAAAGAR